MKTGRLFEIIYLLMDRHQMTTDELARELEVSPRTIRRDIDALSAAGIPVYMSRGKGGGVHLLPTYVLNKALVSEDEQNEILSALAALRSTGASENEASHERLARIFQRDTVDWLDIDFSFWGAPPEYKQAFATIRDAIIEQRLLYFEYYDAAGVASERTVEAIRLDFKESNWYLRAFCRERNDWRTFKLFRIKWPSLKILPERFERRPIPHAMDAFEYQGKTERLVLRFRSAIENRVREEFAPDSIKIDDAGNLCVTLNTSINQQTHYYLLSYGSDLEILEPSFLRTWIREQAQKIIEQYH